MQVSTELPRPGITDRAAVDLDPQVIARNKAKRLKQYDTVQIPALRLAGCVMLSLVVLITSALEVAARRPRGPFRF